MRFLKDSLFLTWAIILAILVGVLWFAFTAGNDSPTTDSRPGDHAVTVGAANSAAANTVDQLRGLAPHGLAAGTDPQALTQWATKVGELAVTGAQTRLDEGADNADQLFETFSAIELQALEVTNYATDPVAVTAARTRVLLLIDRAGNLVNNLPVPDSLPAGTLRPYTSGAPQAPNLPTDAQRPELAPPLPGNTHNHPSPNLTPNPPTHEDLK